MWTAPNIYGFLLIPSVQAASPQYPGGNPRQNSEELPDSNPELLHDGAAPPVLPSTSTSVLLPRVYILHQHVIYEREIFVSHIISYCYCKITVHGNINNLV
jgi:hypothetical protein